MAISSFDMVLHLAEARECAGGGHQGQQARVPAGWCSHPSHVLSLMVVAPKEKKRLIQMNSKMAYSFTDVRHRASRDTESVLAPLTVYVGVARQYKHGCQHANGCQGRALSGWQARVPVDVMQPADLHWLRVVK